MHAFQLASRAITDVATYQFKHRGIFARTGAAMLSSDEDASTIRKIGRLAATLRALGRRALFEPVPHGEFKSVLKELLDLGTYPAEEIVSQAEHAILAAARAI